MMRLAPLALFFGLALHVGATSAQELDGTLRKVRDSGVITMGVRDDSPPFSYLDGQGQPVGFAVDVCQKVVDAVRARLGAPDLRVAKRFVTSADRIPLVVNGTIDLECGSSTNNPERQKLVAFSNTYFLTASRFVSKVASGVTDVDSLAGRTVVSTEGTTNMRQLRGVNAAFSLGLDIKATRGLTEAFHLVETGDAAAFVMDDVLLASFIAASGEPAAYRISGDALSQPEPYGIIIRKDDPAFKALVDDATAALFRSPEGEALYNRWFTQPIPPNGLNLHLPISPVMERAFHNPSDSPDPDHYDY